MIARYREGKLTKTDAPAPWDVDALRDEVVTWLDQFDITNALESIWQLVRRLNQYVEESAPWQLAKDDARAGELDEVLYNLADGITSVAIALAPYLPERARDPRRARAAARRPVARADSPEDRGRRRGNRAGRAAVPARRASDRPRA